MREFQRMELRLLLRLLFLLNFAINKASACIRKPQGAIGDQSPVDDSFQIVIEGNPPTYIPGQIYNVTLSCAINFKFNSFTLVAEAELGTPPGYDLTGHFEIIDSAETRFSTQCENMIENSNSNMKNRVDVAWVAPTNPNSTCVYIKAAVLQHRNVWFMDDGLLTKRICAEEIDDVNSQTPMVNPCCACDEAKYELVLERRWTRNTHAKYFPKEDWRTRFSEVVGASHTYDYRFWAYGAHASLGLKELAEHGATKSLENEIKEYSATGSIRTIIKAPGIPFRKNVMGTTLATVRVDPRHHMVSFVSKIIPSPDWIVGIAGLELCLANCTWIERKVLNMFPWDVGTDAGPSYMSPDQQQIPADVVRRISSTYPSDYRSPFYDETGAAMKPLATLYITRKKLYERECEVDDNVPFECATHPWVDWSDCSTKCGPGTQYRIRAYKDVSLATRFNCEVVLRQTQRCVGTQCGMQEEDVEEPVQNAECELMPWSPWSPCSKSCGRGFTKRTRDFRNPYARESCHNGLQVELEQTKDCLGNACGGTISGNYGNANGGFDQYQHEPGLMEENNYEQSYYPTQRGRNENSGRFNERWDTTSRLPSGVATFGDINQNGYGVADTNNEQAEFSYPNSNPNLYDSNYPNQNPVENNFDNSYPTSRYDQAAEETDSNNPNRLSHQRWISNNRPFNTDTQNAYNNQDNAENTYDQNNQEQYTENRNELTVYNQQYQPRTTERSSSRFQSPGYNPTKKERYPNSQTSYTSSLDSTARTDQGESYDNYGRRTVTTSDINSDYTVVQEHCLQKPYVIRRRCPGKKVVSNYWFYDAEDRECKIFTTDNCDENRNKFRTLEGCEGTCLQPILNLERMQQQPQDGSDWPTQFGEPQSQTRPKKMNSARNGRQGNRNYGGYRRF